MAQKNTIKLKKYVDIINEYQAVAALNPGHLLELTSAGKVQKHSVAGGNAFPLIALEDELQGRGKDVAFAANEMIQVWTACRGEVALMKLKNGQNAAIGDALESAGDGTLQVHGVDSTGDYLYNSIVGYAKTAVDMSGSDGVDPDGWIQVTIA